MIRIERAKQKSSSERIMRQDKLYSFDETRELLGVSAPTLRKYITTGAIEALKLGRKWIITSESIEAVVNPRRKQTCTNELFTTEHF